ncbi:Monopolin complex subunit Csm1/Pcs1 [Penicillium alfredii]|uniref:Monopolin complex subunit Csm1/Pcs1 n=1 Tax=Penicillium alfredii TaxID=1506179 RepID=A0A9W9F9Z6_9EURO|nr:Monopolin complex subunit Csm1/Pcs1 [Penicillium alfredii]KAJ5096154.1 Monopolin complex subunit Csm1/Pcs1 [Penicillium alfredii]
MPKRKVASKISGLVESDDEDLMQVTENDAQDTRDEPPPKKRRGRPRTSHEDATEPKTTTQAKKQPTSATSKPAQAEAPAAKKPTRRGRPRGSSRASVDPDAQARAAVTEDEALDDDENTHDQENEEYTAVKDTKPTRGAKSSKPAPTRGRGRGRAASTTPALQTDGEFEFTPNSTRQRDDPQGTGSRHNEEPSIEIVDETILPEDSAPTPYVTSSPVKNARARLAALRNTQESPRKRKLANADAEPSGDPELRRRLGELSKKHDALEFKYRNLREIGILEANANMEKLRKQSESVTAASNELIASLRSELEAQRAVGQQSRGLQKQLKERDAEMARLKSQADEARSQLSSSQSEVKALQTKLAAARNTAASLEGAAKAPGSAIKAGGPNRANAAASAKAAQAAQLAQLKEDLYSDLTGLIVRDVKNRESDHLYDCIQTGVNGTLHFKLAIPKVSAAEFETAEFQYLPLLDANRDRDLVNILPDFLTVDITFSRQQASKFYTRVIDVLTKRRSSTQ